MNCRVVAFVVAMLVAVGCSSSPGGQVAGAARTAETAATAAVSANSSAAPGAVAGAQVAKRAVSAVRSQAPTRSAESVPFGVADVVLGTEPPPSGLQRSLGPGEPPGPMLAWGGNRGAASLQQDPGGPMLGTTTTLWPSGEPLGGWFAPWDAPLDEVRVVPATLAVSGGVLRGLMRNWSRYLWAYGVTVNAGGREFAWPLSVQPGEVAPFEIIGWDAAADPEQIQISVSADMLSHIDISRGYETRAPLSMVRHAYPLGHWRWGVFSEELRERFPQVTPDTPAGSIPEFSLSWHVGRPSAIRFRPSLDADTRPPRVEDLVVSDLRAYGAVWDRCGRIIDVGPAGINGWTDDGRDFVRVSSLPHPDAELGNTTLWVSFDVYAVPDPHCEPQLPGHERTGMAALILDGTPIDDNSEWGPPHDGFPGAVVLWIGAAHPEQNSG